MQCWQNYRPGIVVKVTAGIHPGIPMPFTNGPEPPPPPVEGPSQPPPVATMRHDAGVRQVWALVTYWMNRSKLNGPQLIAIANWGLNQARFLDKAVISRIRNGLKVRGASLKQMDALAAANHAIWLWQVRGEQKAWAELGPHTVWGVKTDTLNDAQWLPHPDYPNEPLDYADFAEVVAGYLDLPYLGPIPLNTDNAIKASMRLAHLLEQICSDRGWGGLKSTQELLAVYPVGDTDRQQRLQKVISGMYVLSPDELEGELLALAEMIRRVRELPAGEYGQRDLQKELLND